MTNCDKEYVTAAGLRRHAVIHHGLHCTWSGVMRPFESEEKRQYAYHRCRIGQLSQRDRLLLRKHPEDNQAMRSTGILGPTKEDMPTMEQDNVNSAGAVRRIIAGPPDDGMSGSATMA